MEYIKIGQVVKPFGIKGELKVYSYTDFPQERFSARQVVYFFIDNQYQPMTIKRSQEHNGLINVLFEGYEDINLVEKFRQTDIYYEASKLHKLKQGDYYIFEIKGLAVYDTNDCYLGDVIDIEPTGTHNNLRIQKNDEKSFLVPNIPIFIKEINLAKKRITVSLIEGFL